MPDNVLAFMIALGMALILTPVVIAFARRTGALDKPDARKVHVRPIPRIGGIGIYAAFMVSILVQLVFVELTPEFMMSLIGLMVGGTIIVAIGINPDKKSSYTVAERIAFLQDMAKPYPNVRVASYEYQFLVNYAHDVGAAFIVRGSRSAGDYEYERAMRHINADLQPAIKTVFLMPPREIAEISSTMVKGLVGPKGWREIVKRYVPPSVYHKILADNADK